MPKYTFSNREKVMLALLLIIGAGLLWYRFVFINVNDQLSQIQSEQETAQNTITLSQTRLKRKSIIEKALETYHAQGVQPVVLPAYDNLQPEMTDLRRIFGAAASYNLSFDELRWTEDGLIARGATAGFTCGSYDEAKAILSQLYSGAFPCSVDSLQLSDSSARANASDTSKAVSVSCHFTYFEQVTETSPTIGLPPKEEEQK